LYATLSVEDLLLIMHRRVGASSPDYKSRWERVNIPASALLWRWRKLVSREIETFFFAPIYAYKRGERGLSDAVAGGNLTEWKAERATNPRTT